jgi:hypothetical protein
MRFAPLLVVLAACVAGNPADHPATVTLHIEIDGDGPGWVLVKETREACSASCDLEVPMASIATSGPDIANFTTLEIVTPDRFTTTACTFGYYMPTTCVIRPTTDSNVAVTFQSDPNVRSVMLDHTITALGVAADGELVTGTTSGIERLSPSGQVRWTQPTAQPTYLAVGAGDSILSANPVALRRGDGSLVWQSTQTAIAIALGAGPALISGDHRVVALDPATGAVRWMTEPLGVTAIAVSSTGIVAAAAGTTLLRFDPAGTPLPSTTTMRVIESIGFDPADALVVGLEPDPPSVITHTTFPGVVLDATGAPIGTLTWSGRGGHALVPTRDRVFAWAGGFGYDRLGGIHFGGVAMHSLVPGGSAWWGVKATVWSGARFEPELTPEMAACNRERTCAIAGALGGAPLSQWVGLVTLP